MAGRVALADEIAAAYGSRRVIAVPPSAREGGLELPMAYAVEAELKRRRVAAGHRVVGVKAGYANKAVWRALKLETLAWAHMYDNTVGYATTGQASLAIGRMIAPKIEPEIVVRLARPVPAGLSDAVEVLHHVEWIALGYEIIDCPYAGWAFQPADFVAAYGFHAALVVGEPWRLAADTLAALAEQLATFTVALSKDDAPVAQGGGTNVLRSPALCLAELASARARQDLPPLAAGDLVSTGTLTESQPIAPGERWHAHADGLDVVDLTVSIQP